MAYIYDLSDTWNAGGTTFYGIKMNVTNSASAAGSKLLSLQVSGSELFGVDKDGNVGIGTSSPGAKLDVAGSVWVRPGGASGAVADLTADAASGANGISLAAGFASGGYGPIKLLTSATERMRIDTSGNVGIGTTSPGVKLDINYSNTAYLGGLYVSNTANSGNAWGRIDVANTNTGGSLVLAQELSGQTNIINTTNNSMAFGTNNITRMTIGNTGNVGIGTSTPAASLDINGSQVTRGDSSGYILFAPKEGTDPLGVNYDRFEIRVDDTLQVTNVGNANGGTGAARALAFTTAATERVRIKTDGQMRLVPLSGDPAGAENGDMYYNSTTHKFRGYANGSWVDLH